MFALSIQTVFLAHNFFTIDGNSSSESCSGKSILKDLNKAVEAHFNVHSVKLKKKQVWETSSNFICLVWAAE